ncbi:TPA: hypothetical protein ACT9LC_002679 [Legionella pneumophila]|nr:hypothetical protein [Legionella pneumophila]HAT9135183.1 hypothetical protein [Legionella pneumophila subsp. pneumophila]MDW8997296.1 hypothetical protein [Legionella pneumophila]HAT2038529.1 hypothetical protein [Legionella pneumophila]HAU0937126.1 hypothetical protein [Legionella pneumophila]
MNDEFKITIPLKCIYCGEILTGEEDKEYKTDDMINCASCNKANNYGSALDIAQNQGIEEIKKQAIDYAKDHLGKAIKDINKKN